VRFASNNKNIITNHPTLLLNKNTCCLTLGFRLGSRSTLLPLEPCLQRPGSNDEQPKMSQNFHASASWVGFKEKKTQRKNQKVGCEGSPFFGFIMSV